MLLLTAKNVDFWSNKFFFF